MHRAARGILLLPTGLLLLAATAHGQNADHSEPASFAKFEGIDGGATDPQYENWIDVLAIDWDIRRPTISGSGQKRRLGPPVIGDMTLSMSMDQASPELALKGLSGQTVSKLEIEQTANFGGTRSAYLKYELVNVMITKYQTSDSGGSGSNLVINLSLGFEAIKVTYIILDDTSGAEKGRTEMSWKIEEGQ